MGILIVALIIGVLVAGGPPAVDMGLALGSATAERARAIDNNRQRKHERRMAWGDFFRRAWEDRRQRRHNRDVGEGPYKPGVGTYVKELYGAFWWRKIRNLRQRQGINPPPPYEPPGPQVPVEDVPATTTPDGGEPPSGQPNEPVAPAEGTPTGQPSAGDQRDPELTNQPPVQGGDNKEEPVTAPTTTPASNATEVQGNEDLRHNLSEIDTAAQQMADALAAVESALARMKAAATASADAVGAKRFDQGATAAVNEIADNISVATLSAWHELADNAQGAAQAGLSSLEKYRDAEDVVQSNNVDGSTLESAAA